MKTFNIWIYDQKAKETTGPWKFLQAILAKDEQSAIETAKSRFGLNNKYMAYEGI